MRKSFLALLFLIFASTVHAQSTTVSGTVQDASGQTWNNGTFQFTFVPNPQYPSGPYTWTGGTLPKNVTGTLNASGAYSVSVPTNSAISPIGTKWTVQVCSQASSPCYTVANLTVTGTTQTIDVTPPAIAIDLINPPSAPVLAYSDSEIVSAKIGSFYYNLPGETFRVCQVVSGQTCTTWANLGGGTPTGFPRLDQVTDPNQNKTFDFGGTTLAYTNGNLDLSGLTGFLLPSVPGCVASATEGLCIDSLNNNVAIWNGTEAGLIAFLDSGTTYTDGDLLGISVSSGHYKLTDVPVNSPGGDTTIVEAQFTTLVDGETVCWNETISLFVNCPPGVPVNVQTGTTYTFDGVADRGTAIIASNAAAQTYTLGQITDAGDFGADWFAFQMVKGGTVTVNTTTSTFDDTATSSEVLLTGQWCSFLTSTSGDGTIYPKCSEARILPGNGISLLRTPYFLQISSTPASQTSNGLTSGGGVNWTSGLTFEVGAAAYTIAGVPHTSSETSVTLSAADPSNSRIDVIAVDDTGTVVVIAGTASPNPSAPSIDPTTQLSLTFVTVPAGSSTPVVSQTIIYRNNAGSPTEWNCTSTANLNCNSTSNPFTGATHSLEATTAVAGNSATLTIGTGSVNLSSFDTLVFFIRNKASWATPKNLQIFWRNGSTNVGTAITFKNGVYGFDQTNTTTYQQIAIPVTAFQTGANLVTNLRFQVAGGGGSIGFYLGNILLQGGFTGGGGSGGGGSFTLEVNATPGLSDQTLDDSASVTFSQTTSGGKTHITATAIGAPPSGSAGGALAGSYPNPTLSGGTTCTNQFVSAIAQATALGTCTTATNAFVDSTIVTDNGNTTTTANLLALSTTTAGKIQFAASPEVHYIPSANCVAGTAGSGWSYATSTFTSACRAGSNNLGGALQLAPSTGGAAQFRVELPKDWDTTQQPYIRIEYGSGANTSGTVIWTVASACTKADGSVTDDPSFNAESAFGTQTMAAASRAWSQTGQFTAITSGNNCVPEGGLIIKMTLSGTASSVINAYQAVLTIPRKPVVQAE